MTRTAGILALSILLAGCGQRGPSVDRSAPAHTQLASAPTPEVPFTVTSDIPDCLEVVGKQAHVDTNLLLAEVRLNTKVATVRCGCISKWLLYRSVTSTDGLETEFASGSILAADPGTAPIERQVVLLSDRGHPPARPLIVHVGCAPAP